jgi:hypothetical protein
MRSALKAFASVILFGMAILVILAILALVASAETGEIVDQNTTENSIPQPRAHHTSGTVIVTASVPIGNWCAHKDNWETTLRQYDGNVEAMLASQGYTLESFEEYCSLRR